MQLSLTTGSSRASSSDQYMPILLESAADVNFGDTHLILHATLRMCIE